MSSIGETNPTTALANAKVVRFKSVLYPSRSLSATSALPAMVARARNALQEQLKPTSNSKQPFKLEHRASFGHVPYAALYIDCSWADLMFAYQTTLLTPETVESRKQWQDQIAALFRRRHNVYATAEAAAAAQSKGAAVSSSPSPPPSLINVNATLPSSFVAPAYTLAEHNIFTGLSARTCFDLYLSSRAFPTGSHILLSAINIPDMSVVIRAHGLVPVPIDISLDTLQPDLSALDEAAGRTIKGKKPVAILVAHIYGRRFGMDEIIQIGQKHGLDIIEDLAESFSGFEYVGHPSSDLTLFSFGTIKISTGFGGGIARVRSKATYDAMMREQASWAVQTRQAFFTKCVKNTATMLALNAPLMTRIICTGGRNLGIDHRAIVVSMLRGFPDKLMERLRTQPSSAMLSMLHRRLAAFDPLAFQQHQDVCDLLIELLPPSLVPNYIPGHAAPVRNHWLFPIMVDHSEEVLKELVDAGIDTFKGATQLALVPTPPEVKDEIRPTANASDLMDRVIYLPMDKRIPVPAIVRVAATMHKVIERIDRKHGTTKPAGQDIKSKL